MRVSEVLCALTVVGGFSLVGCGGSDEATTISGSELQQYAETHAAEMAEDARIEAEEEAEEDSEEDEDE